MFEHKSRKIASRKVFVQRMAVWLLATLVLLLMSLYAGVLGYRYFEGMPWIDALLNASMILGGMGEVDALKTDGGKLFASIYALYSWLFQVVCGGLLLIPVFHRVLHRFHADQ
jgi:hypothetical protein